ncbi:MAG: flavodoxin-dependent (E)-4-hydroxy-3-methylbut-2-enyl-diphosphate synthase [Eubacteriales bacterium]|nr:flavodoxin-dependent (E)-4-hydroxy-3-methylbut-2-enyl-diphosphate synthase [Eubacteriales bacterium]
MRRLSKEIKIGSIIIGNGNPVAVQSMTNSDTADRAATLGQLKRLEKAGCDIARFTVNSTEAVRNIPYFKQRVTLPLVADIHFDYKLALESAEAGIDKIRINPGNIGDASRVKAVCDICARKNIPIRIGVNSGSLEKEILAKYGFPTPEAIAESAKCACEQLEKFDFDNIVVSVKSSDVRTMIQANRLIAQKCVYPLHLGVTEAGRGNAAIVKSSVGIGALLAEGIGDTIRVSLTDNIIREIEAAKQLLYSLDLKPHIELISCPTCGRTKINLIPLAKRLEKELKKIQVTKTIKVALMGCIVNGPGEASHADIGVAGGNGEALLFYKGVVRKKIPEEEIIKTLVEEIKKLT